MKLVLREPETDALRAELERFEAHLTSVVGGIELHRAVLARVALLDLDEPVREQAMVVGNPLLRTLDAIHLATAFSLRSELGGFACYDARLAAEATRSGLLVVAPA